VPIGSQQRKQFRAAIQLHRQQIIAQRQGPFDPQSENHQHQVDRQAVREPCSTAVC
jgi:hypothetical protein